MAVAVVCIVLGFVYWKDFGLINPYIIGAAGAGYGAWVFLTEDKSDTVATSTGTNAAVLDPNYHETVMAHRSLLGLK